MFIGLCVGCDHRPEGPHLQLPRREWDLGTIPLSEKGHLVQVPVLNSGDADLELLEVKTSCGCTIASRPQPIVHPGEETVVEARVKPEQAGEQVVQLAIRSNDPEAKEQTLVIRWNAIGAFEFRPDHIDFGRIEPFAIRKETIQFIRLATGCRVKNVFSNHPSLETSLAGDVLSVRLAVDEAIGSFEGGIGLELEGTWPTAARIPVTWNVHREIEASPSQLFLGRVFAGEEIEKSIMLIRSTREDFAIKEISVEGIEDLEALGERVEQGVARVNVKWRPAGSSGVHRGRLVVKTSVASHSELTVPISGILADGRSQVSAEHAP